jgi:large subunit ribosomal protein L22
MKKAKEKKQNNIDPSKIAVAQLRYLRVAPRKTRLAASLIRNLSVNYAQAQLMTMPNRASKPILKLLMSCIENAKNNKLDIDRLFVKEIKVDEGPIIKRWIPRAMGRATPIHKKTSHIILILAESDKTQKSRFASPAKKIKKQKKEKIEKEKNKTEKELAKEKSMQEKETKAKDKGFMHRIFRRKSI